MGRSPEPTTADATDSVGSLTPAGRTTATVAPDALRRITPHVDDLVLRGAWNRLEHALFGEPAVPTTVGRYELGEEIGSGGMGRVVMARDPKLDRTVALKLVRTDRLDAETQKRLHREARAMARINHPNVVPVYDVGRHDELVFVAMEYVRGTTLSQWLRRPGPTGWRERLAVVCDAGRGLHAAHVVGILHRDFKPANVLVSDDGRVMVTDFGLARLRSGVTTSSTPTSVETGVSSDPSSVLTQPGMVMGTPAYMAPEQHAGLEADARADQFALCVTLWEALWDARPYQGTLTQLAVAKTAGPPHRPHDREVPRAVASVIRRGLDPDPTKRWPSVEQLVEALLAAAARRGRSRAWAVGTVGLAIAGGIAWTTLPSQVEPTCGDGAQPLRGVWDEARAEPITAAVAALELPHGAQTWARVRTQLDDYGAQWIAGHADACRSAGVRGESSAAALDLRMVCLRAARAELMAVGTRLEHVTPAVLEHADALVEGLTPIDRCADAEALAARTPWPEDPSLREQVERVRARLADVVSLIGVAELEAALAELEPLQTEVDALGYAPLRAELELRRGQALRGLGRVEEAEAVLREAMMLGVENGRHALTAEAAADLMTMVSQRGDHAEAHRVEGFGRAAVEQGAPELAPLLELRLGVVLRIEDRLDEAERLLRRLEQAERARRGAADPKVAEVLAELGRVLEDAGRYEEALDVHREALSILRRTKGAAHPLVGFALHDLAWDLIRLDRGSEAEEPLTEALAIFEGARGPDADVVAQLCGALGIIAHQQGRLDEAARAVERSLAIIERSRGTEHPASIDGLNHLGIIREGQGRPDEADRLLRRALRISEAALGPEHSATTSTLNNHATLLMHQGRYEEAFEAFERANATQARTLGPEHPVVAASLANMGVTRSRQGRHAEAEVLLQRAQLAYEHTLGPGHPDTARVVYELGRSARARGDRTLAAERLQRAKELFSRVDSVHGEQAATLTELGILAQEDGRLSEAAELLEQALEIWQAETSRVPEHGDTVFALARLRWQQHERARARELGRDASSIYRGAGTDPRALEGAAAVERWLQLHG